MTAHDHDCADPRAGHHTDGCAALAPAPAQKPLSDFLPTGRFAVLRVSHVVSAHVKDGRLHLVEADRERIVEVVPGYEAAWMERLGFACKPEDLR